MHTPLRANTYTLTHTRSYTLAPGQFPPPSQTSKKHSPEAPPKHLNHWTGGLTPGEQQQPVRPQLSKPRLPRTANIYGALTSKSRLYSGLQLLLPTRLSGMCFCTLIPQMRN